jgi:ABC-type sugar transport system permease subunit
MNTHTTYALLAQSEEKGRSIMETAVYIMCILSVAVAIFQFIWQPAPNPFAGFASPAQPPPVVSHHAAGAVLDTKS